MSWSSNPSRRNVARPADWAARRRAVLQRDGHTCRLRLAGVCIGLATEVDHIVNVPDHELPNLQAVCTPCHERKTAAEAAAGRRAAAGAARRVTPPSPGTRRPGMPARLP